jgi:hypothetical protein
MSDTSKSIIDGPDSELEMPWVDTAFLVVTRGVASEFEDLSSEVFEDGSEVH